MIKKQYIVFLFLCISCLLQANNNCDEIKLHECYYKEITQRGTIKLFTPFYCNKVEELNKIILQNTDLILGDVINFDSIEQFFNKNKVSDLFTLDSIGYQEFIDENSTSLNYPNIETSVLFIGNNIITYTVTVRFAVDKGSPYYDYISIDLKNNKKIDFGSQIKTDKKDSIKEFLATYAINHKKEIIDNYLHSLSEKADHLLFSYMDVFGQGYYSLTRVKLGEIGVKNFSHLTLNGVVFFLSIVDENFLLDEERNYVGEYTSTIMIPYKELVNYLEKESGLYLYIQGLDAKNVKNDSYPHK